MYQKPNMRAAPFGHLWVGLCWNYLGFSNVQCRLQSGSKQWSGCYLQDCFASSLFEQLLTCLCMKQGQMRENKQRDCLEFSLS